MEITRRVRIQRIFHQIETLRRSRSFLRESEISNRRNYRTRNFAFSQNISCSMKFHREAIAK